MLRYTREGKSLPGIPKELSKKLRYLDYRALILAAHTLLGHQQNASCNNKNRTEDIEDGRTNTAGRRQLGARQVLDFSQDSLISQVGTFSLCSLLRGH